jgi:antitoxin PrlF
MAKNQTVVPVKLCKKLGLKPGDTLVYRETKAGFIIEKSSTATNAPFITFTEWASEADEKAYANL